MTLHYTVIPLLEASFCVTHSLRTHHFVVLSSRSPVDQPRKNHPEGWSFRGGPYTEKLAPIFEEIKRWRKVLNQEFHPKNMNSDLSFLIF